MKRFPWLAYLLVLGFIGLVALAPIISVFVAGSIASAHGCRLDEGGFYPCVINGKDWGETLGTMGVLGWFMLLTLPAGAVAFLIWLIILLLHRSRWSRRQKVSTR
ncbi:MAG: hypothetical protein M3Y86_03995 [Verrucomicrobiota bacterium]|nr:hypothetical protein [Verrucomicrobiota bacterium]